VNRSKKIILGISCILVIVASISFKPISKGRIQIQLKHCAGNAVLQVDSVYKNELGQTFTVSNFKYYMGNIRLKKADGKSFFLADYFLVDERDEDSKQITLNDIPEGSYTSIEFILGVDSLHNCSGAQAGALDPVNGMFWAWNTGYIFLKLEGQSPASKSPGNIFEYHIGGYKQPSNCIRKVTLNFNNNVVVSGSTPFVLSIKADVMEILKMPTTIDFSRLSSVTDFHHATTIADNYADMFSLINK
jgi:hypothetical protein